MQIFETIMPKSNKAHYIVSNPFTFALNRPESSWLLCPHSCSLPCVLCRFLSYSSSSSTSLGASRGTPWHPGQASYQFWRSGSFFIKSGEILPPSECASLWSLWQPMTDTHKWALSQFSKWQQWSSTKASQNLRSSTWLIKERIYLHGFDTIPMPLWRVRIHINQCNVWLITFFLFALRVSTNRSLTLISLAWTDMIFTHDRKKTSLMS